MSVQVMAFGDRIRYIRWFLANITALKPLLDIPTRLMNATTWVEKIEVIEHLLAIIKPIIGSLPEVALLGTTDVATALSIEETEVRAQGFDLQQVQELIRLIWQIFESFRT